MTGPATEWRIAPSRSLSFETPLLVGILNVTPDSFSDGGRYLDRDRAIDHGHSMIEAGAGMLDIGGESTRPGADAVDAAEQIRRTVPVIEGLRSQTSVPISIDTTNAEVAAAALDAGADVVNDVSGGLDDPAVLKLAATRGCGLILMHRRCRPRDDQWSDQYDEEPRYDNVIRDVGDALLGLVEQAEAAGVDREQIAIDPGFGFGKNVEQNWLLIARIRSLLDTGFPIFAGVSRKSFIGAVTGQAEAEDRVFGSVLVAGWLAAWGVQMLRVHDVEETVQGIGVAMGLQRAGASIMQQVLEVVPGAGRMS